MKKLLLCASLLAVGGAFGQYSEDFEGTTGTALPAGWSQVTAATDGGYQTSTDYTSTYFDFPAHTRYVGTNDDVCNCDKSNEKLISSSYMVPTGTQILSFEYILGAYYGEFANVGISTDGGTTVTDLGTLAATNGGGDHVWTAWSMDVSSYAGQTINIVWTYNDNADWGSGLMLDDVEIFAPAAVDMEMTALTTVPTVVAGNVDITGTVTSNGAANITSIDITWNDGSGLNSETFTVNLNYGDSYNFTHGTQLAATAGSTYNVDVCVVATSDADANNDCMTGVVSAVSSIVPKVTVGEEKTGEWCGWCPRGAVALANMSISNPNDFIGIAVHNGDPITVASYDGNIGTYVPGGYPGGGVDRVEVGDPSTFATMHAARVNMIPPASVVATGEYDGTNVTVTISADFVGSLSGDYRLAAVLIEDGVAGTQANYYDDGAAGAMAFPNAGSMPNFDFVGGGATVNPYIHDHVARALGDDEINGAAGSLPASISSGTNETHTYTIPQDAAWAMGNMHVVGMLVNGTTGEILNAGQGSLTLLGLNDVEANSFNVTAMPNPTNGVSHIVVDLDVAADMSLVVVDILGNVVYNMENVELTAGSFQASVDLSNNANGVYFAQVTLNGTVKTVKIIVEK